MSAPRIRVLCVDDHPLVREGIESMIRRQPDMELVAAAATGEEALERIAEAQPDVVLMDLRLPGLSGLDVIRRVCAQDNKPHVIVLTMYEGDEDIFRALAAGAATYLLKDVPSSEVVRTIRQVYAGEVPPLPEEVTRHLEQRTAHTKLTDRELDVLRLMADGMRNRDIAARLGIGEETTKKHVQNILTKLHASNRNAAVLTAVRRGIVHID